MRRKLARIGTSNDDSEDDVLEPGQTRFVQALLTAPTVRVAAEQAGVSLRTGQRWLADPGVQAALRETQSAALQQVAYQLSTAAGEALQTLRSIFTDQSVPPSVRVAAARATLDLGRRSIDRADLAASTDTYSAFLSSPSWKL